MPETSRRPVAIESVLAEHGRLVESALDRYLPSESAPPADVHRAMRYSVFAGGKRLRPMLVIAGAEVAGAPPEAVLPSACAVELIHTYSLIHDDLPSMDDSAVRRGRPTCHVVFGEAMAVLAGDALHAHAFELLAVHAVPAEAEVRQIHRLKTGALIRACLKIGAVLAGAEEGDLRALDRYGEHMGLAFQIIDDILDVVGESGKLGKGTGADASQSKVTFPAVFGLERSRRLAAEATDDAVLALAPLGARSARLEDLAIYLLERDR